MITAILQAGELEGKIRFSKPERTVDIILPLLQDFNFIEPLLTPASLKQTSRRARFEWYGQIKRFTHIYKLKEIF